MPSRRLPTQILHFTHVNHLRTIVRDGLMSDANAKDLRVLTSEIGNQDIKARRYHRVVTAPPYGAVSDYVPFYFAPRSPMMYSIACGNVRSYQGGTAPLIYLVSSLDRLRELDHMVVVSDRNAALNIAKFRTFDTADQLSDGFVDWPLMAEQQWFNTPENPQRRERRMAEALVHRRVRWDAITSIAVRDQCCEQTVLAILREANANVSVEMKPEWYF